MTGAGHLVPDDLDSRLDRRHPQSLGGDHDDHHNCQHESGADTERHQPQIERDEGTLALEHSRGPGPGTLAAAGIHQHDEDTGSHHTHHPVQSFINYPGQGI